MGIRAQQVAEQVQSELSEIIRTRMSDPRIGYVTLTGVTVSDDLSFAKVLVSEIAVEGKPAGRSVKALNHATGFLRSELGKRLRLRQVPELRFEEDHSIEDGIRMTRLLDEIAEGGTSENGERDDS